MGRGAPASRSAGCAGASRLARRASREWTHAHVRLRRKTGVQLHGETPCPSLALVRGAGVHLRRAMLWCCLLFTSVLSVGGRPVRWSVSSRTGARAAGPAAPRQPGAGTRGATSRSRTPPAGTPPPRRPTPPARSRVTPPLRTRAARRGRDGHATSRRRAPPAAAPRRAGRHTHRRCRPRRLSHTHGGSSGRAPASPPPAPPSSLPPQGGGGAPPLSGASARGAGDAAPSSAHTASSDGTGAPARSDPTYADEGAEGTAHHETPPRQATSSTHTTTMFRAGNPQGGTSEKGMENAPKRRLWHPAHPAPLKRDRPAHPHVPLLRVRRHHSGKPPSCQADQAVFCDQASQPAVAGGETARRG